MRLSQLNNQALVNIGFQSSTYVGQNLPINDFVHVFIIDVTRYALISDYHLILSDEELAKSERFLKPGDKQNFIIRKYFLRILLARLLNVPADQIVYKYHVNKKPYLDTINFSVSHTKDTAIIAVGPKQIGIDIERIVTSFTFDEIIPHIFTKDESIFAMESGDIALNFYSLWTRKEALLKATGEGLDTNLNEISILEDTIIRNQQTFHLKTYQMNDDILISVAIEDNLYPILFWTYP